MGQASGRTLSEIKDFYHKLVEADELEDVYGVSLGSWKEDKKAFTKYYMEMNEIGDEIITDKFTDINNTHLRNFKEELGIDEY